MLAQLLAMPALIPFPIGAMASVVQTSPTNGDQLGSEVALDFDGNIMAAVGGGGVYVFSRAGAVWSQVTKITPATGPGGIALSDDGLTLAIGGTDVVYVYQYTGGAWGLGATLTPSVTGGSFAQSFAVAVSGDGNRIAVGAFAQTVGAQANAGALFIFDRVSGNTWTETQRLGQATPVNGRKMFKAVRIAKASKLYVIGCSDASDTAAASVAFNNGGTWAEQSILAALGTTRAHVDISRDGRVAFVGDSAADAFGKIAHFDRNGTNWTKIASVGPLTGSQLGLSFAGMACGPDGEFIAAFYNNGFGSFEIYAAARNGTTWNAGASTFGLPLGTAPGVSHVRRTVAISGDGRVMAIGCPFANPTSRGQVDVLAGTYSG